MTTNSEVTSARIGSIAARGLRDPGSLTHEEIKSLCASALTQRPNVVKRLLTAASAVFGTKAP